MTSHGRCTDRASPRRRGARATTQRTRAHGRPHRARGAPRDRRGRARARRLAPRRLRARGDARAVPDGQREATLPRPDPASSCSAPPTPRRARSGACTTWAPTLVCTTASRWSTAFAPTSRRPSSRSSSRTPAVASSRGGLGPRPRRMWVIAGAQESGRDATGLAAIGDDAPDEAGVGGGVAGGARGGGEEAGGHDAWRDTDRRGGRQGTRGEDARVAARSRSRGAAPGPAHAAGQPRRSSRPAWRGSAGVSIGSWMSARARPCRVRSARKGARGNRARRDARAAESDGLENHCGASHPGFKSQSLRHRERRRVGTVRPDLDTSPPIRRESPQLSWAARRRPGP